MYGLLDISTSGMIAQRTRLEVIAANIANRDAILDAEGNVNPWRRRIVEFAPGDPSAATPQGRAAGVHVSAIALDTAPLESRYDPTHPYADKSGYVPQSNVNTAVEQMNALEAARAYEANVAAAEATKAMVAQALRLLA